MLAVGVAEIESTGVSKVKPGNKPGNETDFINEKHSIFAGCKVSLGSHRPTIS